MFYVAKRFWPAGTLLVLSIATAICGVSYANDASIPKSEVKDLYYGKGLYDFFQADYFSSLTQLLVAKETGRLDQNEDEADLLLGGLYLSYGMLNEAESVFLRLAKNMTAAHTKNRVWLRLAEIFYRRGRLQRAHEAVDNISDNAPADTATRKAVLLASILIREEKHEQAVATLIQLKQDKTISHFDRYNLGVTLIRLGRLQEGEQFLNILGQQHEKLSEEVGALKDKTNLVLGYSALQHNIREQAKAYFARVKVYSPFANQALYGLGQALYDAGQYEDALRYWSELKKRDLRGPAVLESLIALAGTYFQLQAYKQSLASYSDATAIIQRELKEIDTTIERIRHGELLTRMLSPSQANATPVGEVESRLIPVSLRQHYMTQFLASHEFAEAVKTYNDVNFYVEHLRRWLSKTAMFNDMLHLRKQAFNDRLPATLRRYQSLKPEQLDRKYARLTDEIKRIEKQNDAMALATTDEMGTLQRLSETRHRLEKLEHYLTPMDHKTRSEKYRLLRGLLVWRLGTDHNPRLHGAKKSQKELGEHIAEATRLRTALLSAQRDAPATFDRFQLRIEQLNSRASRLSVAVERVAEEHKAKIEALVIEKLERRKARLSRYLEQAQFAVAQIYDIAITPPSDETP